MGCVIMPYEIVCKICGKPITTINPRYTICSDECRKINNYQNGRNWALNNPGKISAKSKKYHEKHYARQVHYCKKCGGKLENNRQSYCMDCLLDAYQQKRTHSWALSVLSCRGLDKEAILLAIEERVKHD